MYSYRIAARVLAWIGIIGIIILSVVPANERPTVAEDWFGALFGHLIEHVAVFALVAGVFAIGYRFSLSRLLILALLYCGGIELLQIPLPTRHARVSDFLVNFAASAIAMTSVHAAESLHGQIKQKASKTAPS
jgi:VanZ family protein